MGSDSEAKASRGDLEWVLVVKNAALLLKWWWHLIEGDDALWKRIVTSNHYKQNSSIIIEVDEGDKGGLWGADYGESEDK